MNLHLYPYRKTKTSIKNATYLYTNLMIQIKILIITRNIIISIKKSKFIINKTIHIILDYSIFCTNTYSNRNSALH